MAFLSSRMTDITTHGGAVIGGSDDVYVEGPSAARVQDPHQCPASHPPNPIIMGSSSVLVNKRMAAIMTSATSCGSLIVMPCAPLVLVGGPFLTMAPNYGNGTVLVGSPDEIRRLAEILNRIAESSPAGAKQISDLNAGTKRTEIHLEAGITPYGDSVNNAGGGITYSHGTHNEIYMNDKHLINYPAEYDLPTVSSATESPEGLLSHEIGHAQCYNENHPSHSSPYPAADNEVIARTNPIRDGLGLPRERVRGP